MHFIGGVEVFLFLISSPWFIAFGFTLQYELLVVGIPFIFMIFPAYHFLRLLLDPNDTDKRAGLANYHLFGSFCGSLGSIITMTTASISQYATVVLWIFIGISIVT